MGASFRVCSELWIPRSLCVRYQWSMFGCDGLLRSQGLDVKDATFRAKSSLEIWQIKILSLMLLTKCYLFRMFVPLIQGSNFVLERDRLREMEPEENRSHAFWQRYFIHCKWKTTRCPQRLPSNDLIVMLWVWNNAQVLHAHIHRRSDNHRWMTTHLPAAAACDLGD